MVWPSLLKPATPKMLIPLSPPPVHPFEYTRLLKMAAPLPEYKILCLPLSWTTLCLTRPLTALENFTPVTALP
jgi:hypothetical protein